MNAYDCIGPIPLCVSLGDIAHSNGMISLPQLKYFQCSGSVRSRSSNIMLIHGGMNAQQSVRTFPWHGALFLKDVPAHESATRMRSTHNMTTCAPLSQHMMHNLAIESSFKCWGIAHMKRYTSATQLKHPPLVTRVLNHHAVEGRQVSSSKGFYTYAFSPASAV